MGAEEVQPVREVFAMHPLKLTPEIFPPGTCRPGQTSPAPTPRLPALAVGFGGRHHGIDQEQPPEPVRTHDVLRARDCERRNGDFAQPIGEIELVARAQVVEEGCGTEGVGELGRACATASAGK